MRNSFVFRADATASLGIGHVKRCLRIAETLRPHGESAFLYRWLTPALERELRAQGVALLCLDTPGNAPPDDVVEWLASRWRDDAALAKEVLARWGAPDLLVVDHYGLDARWEGEMRGAAESLLVIDDLANRRHDCDLLVDPTFQRDAADYLNLVPGDCRLLCGSQYALTGNAASPHLRCEAEARRRTARKASRLLVSFGGTDPGNISSMALDAIAMLPFRGQLQAEVLLTSAAPHIAEVAKKIAVQDFDVKLTVDAADMGPLLLNADLAIGAGGGSSWERAALGLPTITVVAADNQRKVAAEMEKAGAISLLGPVDQVTPQAIGQAVSLLWEDADALRRMGACALKLCDGFGVDRVAEEILASKSCGAGDAGAREVNLRKAAPDDQYRVFTWQSTPGLRRYSRNPAVPALDEHVKWFRAALEDRRRRLFIIECNGLPAGVVRLDRQDRDSAFEVSIAVSQAFQKRGIAGRAIGKIQGMDDVRELRAYIKSENRASIKLFTDAGFLLEADEWYVWNKRSA